MEGFVSDSDNEECCGLDLIGAIDETEAATFIGGRALARRPVSVGVRLKSAIGLSQGGEDALKTGGILVAAGLGLWGIWKLGSHYVW